MNDDTLPLVTPAIFVAGESPPTNLERPYMVRHSTMKPRNQKTPHGDVTLTSKWKGDHYMLMASGSRESLHWMFPNMKGEPELHGNAFRHAFNPAKKTVTVERELSRMCAQWQADWTTEYEDHGGSISDPSSLTNNRLTITSLGQLFDHLHAQRKATVAFSTSDRDRYRLKLWRDELGTWTPLSSLSAERISSALTRIGKLTSAPTANPALGVLKTYLNWAVNMGFIKDLSFRLVRPLKEHANARHRRPWWTTAEVEMALSCAARDSHRATAMLLLACGCYLGLRVEEITRMRWQDLSLDATDTKTGEPRPVCHLTPHDGWQPKNGKARDIPICTPLLAVLKELRQPEGYLLQQEKGRAGRPRMNRGSSYRYDPTKVWARVMKAVTAAGGKAITMNMMRHSFASNYLIAGVSDVKVSRWLGHSDTRMIHRHYGHLMSYDGDINAVTVPKAPSIA